MDADALFPQNKELEDLLMMRHIELKAALGEEVMRELYRQVNAAHNERENVARLLETDKLTGLVKKDFFEAKLQEALDEAVRTSQKVALMFIDLDRFKKINDRRGHEVGDNVLGVAALRLMSGLRKRNLLANGARRRSDDIAVRWGGDEFAIIAHISGEEEAFELAARIAHEFDGPIALGSSVKVELGLSIGIAIGPKEGEDTNGLMKRADAAMYEAKKRLDKPEQVKEEKRKPWRIAP